MRGTITYKTIDGGVIEHMEDGAPAGVCFDEPIEGDRA